MAIYTYKCTKCDKEFVVQHSMSERPETCNDVEKYQHDKLDLELEFGVKSESFCEEDAPIKRVIEKPSVDMNEDRKDGKDLEYRVRQGIEEAKEKMKKDKDTGIKIDLDDLGDKFK